MLIDQLLDLLEVDLFGPSDRDGVPGLAGTSRVVRSRSTRCSSRLTRSRIVCSTPWLVIVVPPRRGRSRSGSAIRTCRALPWAPRSGAA